MLPQTPPPPLPPPFSPLLPRFPSILVPDLRLIRIANRTSSSVSRRPVDDYFVEALAQSVTFTWTNLFSRVRRYRARKANTKERKKLCLSGSEVVSVRRRKECENEVVVRDYESLVSLSPVPSIPSPLELLSYNCCVVRRNHKPHDGKLDVR